MIKSVLIIILFSNMGLAADGFKDLKFGMSIVQVKSLKYCNLEFKPNSEKTVDLYVCNDLKFGKQSTMAQFYFINNKFQKIIITVGKRYSDMELAATFLRDEFGSPSSMFDMRAIQAFNAGIRDELSIGFDDNTVMLKLAKIGRKGEVTLTYSTHDYYALMLGAKRRNNVVADFFKH